MTLRESLHRWWVIFTVVLTLSVSAWRHMRRARYRRRARRKVDLWPW